VTRFGVHLGVHASTMTALRLAWEAVDESEFGWISVADRALPLMNSAPPDDGSGQFDAVACLGAMAVATLRTRLGCLVFSAIDRHPALVARAGSTIDQLSDGRLELGVGAGRRPAVGRAGGSTEEPPEVRLRRMAECVQVIRLLWTQENTDFDGEFFHLTRAPCGPKPVQQPPRIWVGTAGGGQALELAGRLGDGWNAAFIAPDDFARKLSVVKEAAPDPDRLSSSVIVGFLPVPRKDVPQVLRWRFGGAADALKPAVISGSADAMLDGIARYVAGGPDWIILAPLEPLQPAVTDSLVAFGAEAVSEFG
jgi:alkanesulfonate monooxygenase SsuD/methylene tetrahydromethanopterin reductase-like flavin-dependent oxidoreductase (luciferase family)